MGMEMTPDKDLSQLSAEELVQKYVLDDASDFILRRLSRLERIAVKLQAEIDGLDVLSDSNESALYLEKAIAATKEAENG